MSLIIFFILSWIPFRPVFPPLSQERILIKVNERALRISIGASLLPHFPWAFGHMFCEVLSSPDTGDLTLGLLSQMSLVVDCLIPCLILTCHPCLKCWGHAELSTLTSDVFFFTLTVWGHSSDLKTVSCVWCALIIQSLKSLVKLDFLLTHRACIQCTRAFCWLELQKTSRIQSLVNSLLTACQITDSYCLDYCSSFLDGSATVLASL